MMRLIGPVACPVGIVGFDNPKRIQELRTGEAQKTSCEIVVVVAALATTYLTHHTKKTS